MSITLARYALAAIVIFTLGIGAGAKLEKGARLALENRLMQASNKQLTENIVKAELQNRANKEVINDLQNDYKIIDARFADARARLRRAAANPDPMPGTPGATGRPDDRITDTELFEALREAERTTAKLHRFRQWATEQREIYNRKINDK